MIQIFGCMPATIIIRTGNLTTNEIADVLKANRNLILQFISDSEISGMTCLEIDK